MNGQASCRSLTKIRTPAASITHPNRARTPAARAASRPNNRTFLMMNCADPSKAKAHNVGIDQARSTTPATMHSHPVARSASSSLMRPPKQSDGQLIRVRPEAVTRPGPVGAARLGRASGVWHDAIASRGSFRRVRESRSRSPPCAASPVLPWRSPQPPSPRSTS
jgi:hypothetical protein